MCWQVRIGADTADHDLAVKLRQAQGFVEKNFRVKLVVRFGRWRQTEGGQRMRDLVERSAYLVSHWLPATGMVAHLYLSIKYIISAYVARAAMVIDSQAVCLIYQH